MTLPVGRPGGGVSAQAARPIKVHLACTSCGEQVRMPGPWRQDAITAWSSSHRKVVLLGWTVVDGAGGHSNVTCPPPPLVRLRS